MKTIPSSRREHHLVKVCVFLIMAALIAGMTGSYYVGGGDTQSLSQNLAIRTWYDLDDVRDNLDGDHILMNDLDSNSAGYTELASPTANQGKGWDPIGFFVITGGGCEGGGYVSLYAFEGTFDGQGHEIRDLFINRPGENDVGLFGVVEQSGVIKNIGVVNVTVNGRADIGGLAGENDGTVSNSYSTGSVTGSSGGGLVGENDGDVSNSYSTVNVTADDWVAGGLAGANSGTVSNCHATGSVTGKESESVGGLVGENFRGTVSDSYSTGSVTGSVCVGGLAGENTYGGTVSDSYSTGSVSGDAVVGGLVGWNTYEGSTVSDSYSTGNVTAYAIVGGLVGGNEGTVSNSYSTGNVTGEAAVGGLLGGFGGTVSNSFYSYDEVLINGENIITIGALFNEDFEEWLANDKFLDIDERLSQENGYYVVNNVTDFKELLAFGQDNSLKFRLKNDLDLATEPNFYIPYLAGEFDGNGHKISNLSFNFGFVSPVGLFGYLAPGGKVTQVGAEDINITGISSVGGLVGGNEGTVNNSYSTGNVTGTSYLTSYHFGGLVGYNSGNVSNSYATGSVTGDVNVGGLVGYNHEGTLSNCYATNSVIGNEYVGGLVGGHYSGTVSNSFWDIETSGQDISDGGTGKNTTEMKDIITFSGAGWNIVAVALNETNPAYIWNIVHNETYPFLSWET